MANSCLNLIVDIQNPLNASSTKISVFQRTAGGAQWTSASASEDDREISDALITIEKRSQGLMRFVKSFRDLTRISQPDIRILPVRELVHRVEQLMGGEL